MTDCVDYWKEPEFRPEDIKEPVFAESEFRVMFPDYRAPYLKQIWPKLTDFLRSKALDCVLDLVAKTMIVKTTPALKDPVAIVNARDLLRLLARSVPFHTAKNVFDDEVHCDIIKLSSFVSNNDKLARRRQRLIGPDASTLKAIELLTQCQLFIAGQTACVVGPWKGLKKCNKLITDCMKNIHPVYSLKQLMVERALAQNPAMANKDWTPYLPKYKRTLQKRRKVVKK
uniref:KRR-R motif-containing protein 1 n=1 Tax=Dermatophagoides pteronyssinus TaxID=6956 RepID=A0A6P6Y4F5_DERPT|nr:KRR1 small subunit processome component-like [Dermatophagoides pteronyssinus]